MDTPLDRDQFPVCRQWAYLDNAAIGPIPLSAVEAMGHHTMELATSGGLAFDDHQVSIERIRAAAARMMGVPATDVAFVKNTTEGLGFIANGLQWAPGDRVVVPALEFPSATFPWSTLQDRGVSVSFVHPRGPGRTLPVSAFAEVMDAGPAPKLVATSWVQFGRGWRTDLAELAEVCRERGSLLCVDAIQGLGVVPARFEEWGVDFAAADGHKWLLGPAGSGVLYVRRSHLGLLRPLEPGWHSVRNPQAWDELTFDPDDTARRLEGGMLNAVGILGMGASLTMFENASVAAVWEHVHRLCEHAVARLGEAGATVLSSRSHEGRSGILTFRVGGVAPEAAVTALKEAGVACSARGGGLRVSPHGYNNEEDIDRLVRAVAILRHKGQHR